MFIENIIFTFKFYSVLLLALFSMSLVWFIHQTFSLIASCPSFFPFCTFLIVFCKQHYNMIMFQQSWETGAKYVLY